GSTSFEGSNPSLSALSSPGADHSAGHPMTTKRSYLAVVPAYNEAATIVDVVRAIRDRAPDFDVLVVDDGSTDDTRMLAEAAGARVLHHPFNLGIGGAVQSGFVYALEYGYDYMMQVDGDGQHDPLEIQTLLDAMRLDPSLDMVCGSRFIKDFKYP